MWVQGNPRRRAQRSDQIRTGINSWYSFDFTCDQSKQLPGARPHRATATGLRPTQNIYARIVVRRRGRALPSWWNYEKEDGRGLGYRVVRTERTEPGSSELLGDTDRENWAWFKWTAGGNKWTELSLVQVNYWGIRTERTESGSSELPGDTNRVNSAWFKWTTGWYKQRELSPVQLNYRAVRTERTEPGSSELLGETYSWPEPG